jgi:branched-chain amino acid transport system substrate-binding protein
LAVLVAMVVAMLAGGCGAGGPTGTAATTTQGTKAQAVTTTTLPKIVRIGALFPLTGDLASDGQECVNGMRLAASQVNASGGIKSLGGAKIEVVQADTGGDSQSVKSQMAWLVGTEQVSAVGGAYQSSVAMRAAQEAEGLKVPFVVSTGAADEITESNLKYTFRICPKAEWYARDQVGYLVDLGKVAGQVPVSRVALLHENGTFGKQVASEQRKYLSAAGIQVVDEIAYPANHADFDNEMQRIGADKVQAVLTATYLDDAVLIASSAAKQQLGILIVDAGSGTTDRAFLSDAGGNADGIVTELNSSAAAGVSKLGAEYQAAYGTALTGDALYSYQAVWVLANALERSASIDSAALRAALATTSMSSSDHMLLPQGLLTFDASGQNRAASLLMVRIENSKYVPAWPVQSP